MRVSILHSHDTYIPFLNHLLNVCDVCDYCTSCRPRSLNMASHIHGLISLPSDLPLIIEEPASCIPPIPPSDVLILIDLHPDILLELPDTLVGSPVKAVIAPIDSPQWIQPGLQRQLQELCEAVSIESAFPKPYCSLKYEESHPHINEFMNLARLGKPKIEVDIEGDIIRRARCIISAPCGSTWYVCEQLHNTRLDRVADTVASAHHSFPCNASMSQDPELKDTILHEAGYIIRKAVYEAVWSTGTCCNCDTNQHMMEPL